MVIEVSPNLRRELLALCKLKIQWSIRKVEDFVSITRCLKCLGFGNIARFCQNQQKCLFCTGDHHWKECDNKHSKCCSNCAKANTYIHDDNRKTNINHSAFSKEYPTLRRIVTSHKQDRLLDMDSLAFAQINTHHCKAAKAHLSPYTHNNKVDVLIIQEPWRPF